ncbi:MerR family transcriptional regulator [Rhodococcus sp. 05-340-1]|nr:MULTISPECIES: MerR family transcriptional regulator [Rhodococcus]OZC87733.1 MerR family transcriptional regulator [Rhodococcus sp. 06-412-2C]OZC96384.1 MerR family transcriptional regulator [Rhodococcus sp. 06-412-2B]OZD65368.1 MerR family transcriptional regulator [Rhodococcus sp. 05-340-2]OZD74586.1 MerR family transcriptional regulator [Rhodococcus sp. 05-340-1]OZD86642.1 MerR family transcriptional regulator [Rhodococcus sp. 05-339-2]
MRIGELASATNTSVRLLRYYEERQLIVSTREPNGYRAYDDRFVDRVLQIRGLLDAGLPTRIIKQILPCLDKPRVIHFADATPDMIALLTHERDRMEERALNLMKNRDAIASYLDEVIDIANEGSTATPQSLPTRTDDDNTAPSPIAS